MRVPCVYILASKPNGTLYVGVTSDLIRRLWEHKTGEIDGLTKTYGVNTLVYFELHATMPDAILREKQIKKWRRAWKIDLIRRGNPAWRDLYDEIAGSEAPAAIPACAGMTQCSAQKKSSHVRKPASGGMMRSQ